MLTLEISRTIGGLGLRRGLITLWCFVAVGCVGVTNEPTKQAITTGPTAAVTPPPAADVEPRSVAPVAAAAPVTEELVTEEFEPAASPIPPLVASPTSAETLDFSSLVTRLRKTKAINLRTKVAVKNESDDLLEQARAYHTLTGETTLADLRRSYDSLFHKLHSLLEDADPPLARDIDRSRAAIWELLADPRKFSSSHLVAGG